MLYRIPITPKKGSAKIQFIFIMQQDWGILFSLPDGSQKVPYFYVMKTRIPRQEVHHGIYMFSLVLLVCCLPLSRYVLSISQFLLLLNWLTEGRLREKAVTLRQYPSLWIFMSVILVYLLGSLYSANLDGAITKVKNVLPLVLLPLVVATSKQLNPKDVSRLFLFYSLAVIAAAVICIANYLIDPSAADRNFRKFSIFMPHIRFALLIILDILILLYLVLFKPYPVSRSRQATYVAFAFFLIVFLFLLRSFAGIIILFLCLVVFIIRTTMLKSSRRTVYVVTTAIAVACFMAAIYIILFYTRNFSPAHVDLANLDKKTANGHAYEHNLDDRTMENGHYVNLYVCEPELRKEWNARSRISYDSTDLKGQPVFTTLKRYLTSRGLRKDSASLSTLGSDEIRAIEKGLANYAFSVRPGLYQRLYETLWEVHIWRVSGYVKWHSFGQRLVYYQSAGRIIRNNWLTGVGTGDVYSRMLEVTRKDHEVEARWKGEPHNQFTFLLMAFGIPGFAWILFAWIYPVVVNRSTRYLLFNLFAVIILVSMMVLDTIESYDNMVYFAFFYTLFVFGPRFPIKENLKAG